jgi:hypothetical protein
MNYTEWESTRNQEILDRFIVNGKQFLLYLTVKIEFLAEGQIQCFLKS